MTERSNRPEVRNPVLRLDAARRLKNMNAEAKCELRQVLLDLRAEAKLEGDRAWRRSKYMMAAYWKVVAVYAGHIARALGSNW